MGKELHDLQSALGVEKIEDLTIHAWNVLRYLTKTIRHRRFTLSQEAIHWISQPTVTAPAPDSFQESTDLSHHEIDRRILQEIHHLLDDDHIEQALKVTHILKLLKSHAMENPDNYPVKSEMLLTAAETFAAECDPEKAAQLILDATHPTTDDNKDSGY